MKVLTTYPQKTQETPNFYRRTTKIMCLLNRFILWETRVKGRWKKTEKITPFWTPVGLKECNEKASPIGLFKKEIETSSY